MKRYRLATSACPRIAFLSHPSAERGSRFHPGENPEEPWEMAITRAGWNDEERRLIVRIAENRRAFPSTEKRSETKEDRFQNRGEREREREREGLTMPRSRKLRGPRACASTRKFVCRYRFPPAGIIRLCRSGPPLRPLLVG